MGLNGCLGNPLAVSYLLYKFFREEISCLDVRGKREFLASVVAYLKAKLHFSIWSESMVLGCLGDAIASDEDMEVKAILERILSKYSAEYPQKYRQILSIIEEFRGKFMTAGLKVQLDSIIEELIKRKVEELLGEAKNA